MHFPYTKGVFPFAARLIPILFLVLTPQAEGQEDFSLSDLSRLRTMANTPTGSQTGMEVGDVNVPSIMRNEQKTKDLPQGQSDQPILQILFDCNKIDPDHYILGPDDQLLLFFFGEMNKEYFLTTTPEGTVNIPTVGAIVVGGKSLSEAKQIITLEVGKRYRNLPISITLARPRFFRIFVSGMVRTPGAVETHALQRVSDVMDRAGLTVLERYEMASGTTQSGSAGQRSSGNTPNPATLDFDPSDPYLLRESSQRTIIIHRGEKSIPVDLMRFRRFGDLDANPYVNAGDRIEVPPYVGSVYAYGQVNDQGRYEFKPGDRVLDAIQFAGGLTPSADTTRATLTRFDEGGKLISKRDVNLYEAMFRNPDAPEFRLEESDRLNVWRKYDYKVVANASISGEIMAPGAHSIVPNETTLSELITMAGGLTENANLEEARFLRASSSVQDLEYQRLSRMMVADMTEEEYELFKHLSRARRGEISVNFVKLIRENDKTHDITLQDNDRIIIPVKRQFVNVIGAVQQPGFMQVEMGKDVAYYVAKAGGYNYNASKSKTRIIKAQTGQQLRPSKRSAIEGGDTIHIPEKKPIDTWAALKDGALLFANVATIVILARQLTE